MTTTATTTATTNKKTEVFVYGTLKQGFPNHHLISPYISTNEATFMGLHKTHDPYPLIHGPFGIPFLINRPGSGHPITGELYSVSPSVLARLDHLEGIGRGHYERLPITVTPVLEEDDSGSYRVREVEGYFADEGYAEEMWKKCWKEGVCEYLIVDAGKYVGVEARDVGFSLGDYVRLHLRQIDTIGNTVSTNSVDLSVNLDNNVVCKEKN